MRLKYWQPRQELSKLPIRLDPAAQEADLAPWLTELIQHNVEERPGLKACFDRLHGTVAVKLTGLGPAATMEFLQGKLLVHSGATDGPDLVVTSDWTTLREATGAKLCLGFPDATHPSGRALIAKLLSGKVKIRGRALLLRPLMAPRLARLMNVHHDHKG